MAHEEARITAAAKALHSWIGDVSWNDLPEAIQEERRRHARWVLLAADAVDAQHSVSRVRKR